LLQLLARALCCAALRCAQVTKYVEREIINHRQLVHPHIVQFKEVRVPLRAQGAPAYAGRG
jgi:hypothetical protein